MARRSGMVGTFVALGILGLLQSGAGDRLFAAGPEKSYMSSSNPWSKGHVPAAASAPKVYFRNCDAARAAGMAPMGAGDPGYRSALDGDGDGVACEPYYGR